MARTKVTRGMKAARTRARNKKLAAKAAEIASLEAASNSAAEQYAADVRRAQEIETREQNAYNMGRNDGRVEGFDRGYKDGCDTTRKQLRDAAENLAERRTELGSAASVIDSMTQVVNAGSQALTTYFGDKQNGPHANALAAIDSAIAGLPTPKTTALPIARGETPISIASLMGMLGVGN